MRWSKRVIGTDIVGDTGSMAMAAHAFEPDASLHLIVREPGSNDLRSSGGPTRPADLGS